MITITAASHLNNDLTDLVQPPFLNMTYSYFEAYMFFDNLGESYFDAVGVYFTRLHAALNSCEIALLANSPVCPWFRVMVI